MIEWVKDLYERVRPWMDQRTVRSTDRFALFNEYMEVLAASVDTGLDHGLLTDDDRERAMAIIDQSTYFRKTREGYRHALLGDRQLVAA